MTPYRDTWPSLDRLWSMRRVPFITPQGYEQRVCVTCSGLFTAGHYLAHLRSVAHRDNRGWWK